jgi:hypothetical protein
MSEPRERLLSLGAGSRERLSSAQSTALRHVQADISFGPTYTVGPLDNSPPVPIGEGLASSLLGIASGGSMRVNTSYAVQSTCTGFFVQDDWKPTSPRPTTWASTC